MSSDQDVQREIEQLEQRFAENSRGLVFAHLADAYRRAHEYAKAEGLILHGLKNHPSYISAYNVLGRIYLDSDRLADAHAQFTRVLELDPHNLIALRALGDLAAKEGRSEEARAWYEQMLQVDPRNDAVREELRKLSAEPGEGAGAEPETAPADATEAVSTTHPGSGSELAEAPWSGAEEGGTPVGGEEGSDAGVFDIVAGGELVDEIPDLLTTESDAKSLEAMPWEDIRDVSSLDLEAGAEVDEGKADRTAVEPEEVVAEGVGSLDAELEARLQALGEPEGSPEAIDSEEGGGAVGPLDEGAEVDLSEIDNWMPGLFDREPQRSGETDTGGSELETDSFIDALERGFDPGAEREGEEDEPPAQRAQGGGLITETMAELYARQGLHAEALRVYRKLAESRPDNARLQQRIADLEERLTREGKASQESELLELLDITGMAERTGGASGAEEAVEESAALDLEPWGEATGEAPPHMTDELGAEVSEEEGVEDREGEADLEELTATAAFTGESDEPSGEEEFHFADEVPVAGLEQLDPFAASFEIIGREGLVEPARRGDGSGRVQAKPASDEGEPLAADTGSGDIDAEAEGDATAAMALEETETPLSEAEVGADVESPVDVAPAEPPGSGEAEISESPEKLAEQAPTIERYLFGLLDFDPETSRGGAGRHANSNPPGQASGPATRDPEPDEETDMVPGSNDLEQFQEWLRGLRH